MPMKSRFIIQIRIANRDFLTPSMACMAMYVFMTIGYVCMDGYVCMTMYV